ncbi:MAG: GNAT family N-acetyltransferase [Woeseiaceae bacterium]
MNPVTTRYGAAADLPAIETLYPAAFPDEDLLPLVRQLLPDSANVLSLVAEVDAAIVGHVAFSRCSLAGTDSALSLLAPLAVAPTAQRAGVGTSLTNAGIELLRKDGVAAVLVLGDPAYYGRFGFAATTSVTPPYDLPVEYMGAWQLLELYPGAAHLSGRLRVPEQWRQPALWAP